MGLVKFLTVRFVEVIGILLLIIFMPNLPPKSNFTHYKVTPPQKLEGNLAVNDRLNGVEHYLENELVGPEAFAEYNGELYTSLRTGEVVKISKGHIVPVAKFGKPCTGLTEESICGRPLGLQFDKNGNLYVADAYMGLWKVDVKTGLKTQLVSMNDEIEGKKPKIPNSLAVSENGDIYWTDSSTEFSLEDGVYTALADGSGRLIHYNAKTKTNKVLMDGLHFANGVHLSKGEEFLVVSETFLSRLSRYYLKGSKAGTYDVFADGLPGTPDNVCSDGEDGFFIPMYASRDEDHPILLQILGPFPLIRKLVARILGLTELGFQMIHNLYPNVFTQLALHKIGHFETVQALLPTRVSFLHYSKDGELIQSFHSTDKSIKSLSEVFVYGDYLYLGSPHNNYIGRLPLSKVGLEHLTIRNKREVPVKQTASTKETVKKASSSPAAAASSQETVKKAPPPPAASASSKETVKKVPPPPAAATTKENVKKSSPPPAATTKETIKKSPPPTAAPVKPTTPPPSKTKPVQNSPPPTAAPVKPTTPSPKPKPVQNSQPQPSKDAKQTVPEAAPIKKENMKPTPAAPVKNPSTINTKPSAAQKPLNDAPKVVPIKENVPKTESVNSKK